MPCAVKALASEASEWDEEQFNTEVKLLSTVYHPYLCRFYACSTNGPRKCLLLELMDNSLDGRLVEKPPLGSKQCVLIARNICSSLAHLHSLSPPVIHRDVKSQNILISGFGSSILDESADVAKLADFGTVRPDELRIKQEIRTESKGKCFRTDGKTHATTRRVVGTGPYMPQEYAGRGHVSAKTDAFAMGIVIIELLIARAIEVEYTEDYPFKARDLVDTEDNDTLPAVLQDMASNGGWTGNNETQAAKILADVAVGCTRPTGKRQTPATVLSQIESAYTLITSAQ
jgi:serine/threonine protein kinase